MDRAVRDAVALIRHFANGNTRDADPVSRADARTSMADARTALCIAKGVAIEDIDPTTGYEWSAAAYADVRASWRSFVSQEPLSEYTRPWFERAYGSWLVQRPDLAAGDDWFAGIKVECGDCGALVPVVKAVKACRYDHVAKPPRLVERYAMCPACAIENGA